MALNTFTTTGGMNLEGMLFLNKSISLLGGNGLLLDDDGDTGISAKVANTMEFKVAGGVDWTMTSNILTMSAASKLAGQGGNVAMFAPQAAEQRITDSVAVGITEYNTKWTTTAPATSTLADGASIGQLKRIHMVSDGGDGVLTPANLAVGTTITYADAGDYVILSWDTGGWVLIEAGNTVDGVSEPVVA